jgi:hypothetical protein
LRIFSFKNQNKSHQNHNTMRTTLFTSLLFILLNTCFTSCSNDANKINDWQRMNLNGRVQQIDELKYPTFQDFQQKQNAKKSFTRFTTDGLISKSGIYMGANDILWMKYEYKGDSVWIVESREINSKNDYPQSYWLYKVDSYGAQRSITSILIDSSINFHIETEVNKAGNVTEIVYRQQKHPEHVPCKISKVYNENGTIKEEFSYRYNNILEECDETPTHSIFKTNKQGHIERENMTIYNGRARVYSYQYEYDKQGNWTQRNQYIEQDAGAFILRELTYYKDE